MSPIYQQPFQQSLNRSISFHRIPTVKFLVSLLYCIHYLVRQRADRRDFVVGGSPAQADEISQRPIEAWTRVIPGRVGENLARVGSDRRPLARGAIVRRREVRIPVQLYDSDHDICCLIDVLLDCKGGWWPSNHNG